MNKLTPMMHQYLEIKAKYPDALLLYRMGDFYELFMDDAVRASKILEIALTSRDKQAENPVPMCGVPYHAAEAYVARLVAAGNKVAICDQVEDPRKAKGLVRREVTRVITPGLILESQNLTANQPNYLAAVSSSADACDFGLAYLDISTAEFRVVELDSIEVLLEEIQRVSPREILVSEDREASWTKALQRSLGFTVTRLNPEGFDYPRSEERLVKHFRVHSLEGFGVQGLRLGIEAAGAILTYMQNNLLGSCEHVRRLAPYNRADYMILDEATVRNLEVFQSSSFQGRKGSLLAILDGTHTPMGARKLRQWLRFPLLDLARIEARQEAVAALVDSTSLRMEMLHRLERMNDIERLNSRNSTSSSTPRDLIALKKSLRILPHLREALEFWCMAQEQNLRTFSEDGHNPGLPKPQQPVETTPSNDIEFTSAPDVQGVETSGRESWTRSHFLSVLSRDWDDLSDLAEHLEATLMDPPPVNLASGGVICPGVHADLDRYTRLSRDAKAWMAEYETAERQRTGINSLKVRYNKVFGYYIEVSNANRAAVPADYFRKQTLVNAERFITEELKTFETEILQADEKRFELEQQLFIELRRAVGAESERIQRMAERVAVLDSLTALAEVAARNDYCRPDLVQGDAIQIRDGRHPVIEHFLQEGTFVPNDLHLNMEDHQVLIITGPNMAGKSTILRQAALLVLMAQIGSFVPATEARIGIVDRIFTRVGASDDLARGRSTFMVEMQETANILNQATPKSLIILDEIGRGTSTFDGLSIAWAVAEHLHDFQNVGIKTLFATHYHELTELATTRSRVKNFNVAIKEWQNEILFFHKLLPGGTNRSYGIQVAQLAGLPREVTERARDILAHLEKGGASHTAFTSQVQVVKRSPRSSRDKNAGLQLSLFRPSLDWLRDQIMALDLDQITPMAALQMLHAFKEQIRKGGAHQDIQRKGA